MKRVNIPRTDLKAVVFLDPPYYYYLTYLEESPLYCQLTQRMVGPLTEDEIVQNPANASVVRDWEIAGGEGFTRQSSKNPVPTTIADYLNDLRMESLL